MLRKISFIAILLGGICLAESSCKTPPPDTSDLNSKDTTPIQPIPKVQPSDCNTPFVVLSDIIPNIKTDIRYATNENFMGRPADGYLQNTAICTKEAAYALKKVSDSLSNQGLCLKIFDAYRPARAVADFRKWAANPSDTLCKPQYYPREDKNKLFAFGYLSNRSFHSHGSTIDLTICQTDTGEELDMGTDFDLMDPKSHYHCEYITTTQQANRKLLRDLMKWAGFTPINNEWWHFRLQNEPYSQSFNFPVHRDSIPKNIQ